MKKQEDLLAVLFSYLVTVQFHGNLNKKKSVTLSTAEVEFVSLTECAKQCIYFKKKKKLKRKI